MESLHSTIARKAEAEPSSTAHSDAHRAKCVNNLTLYDVAKDTLKAQHIPIKNSDEVYHKLNSMMVEHHHQKANIDHRAHINDHMLPKQWNYVSPRSIIEHGHAHGHVGRHPHASENPPRSQHDKTSMPQVRLSHAEPAHYGRYADEENYTSHPEVAHYRQYHQQYDSGIGDAIGGVLGRLGAGIVGGLVARHNYGYYQPHYGWNSPNAGGWDSGYGRGWSQGDGGGWDSGYGRGWSQGDGGGWNRGYGGGWNNGYDTGWNNGYGGGYRGSWNRSYGW